MRIHFKQSDFPVTVAVWVEPRLKQYRERFVDAVDHAFQKWCDASGGYLRYKLVPEQKSAKIVCKMLTKVRGTDGPISGLGVKLGETLIDPSDVDLDFTNFSRVEVFFAVDQDTREIEAITLHEVGHALGLPHSGNPKDIMFPYAREPYAPILSQRDKNSIRILYDIGPHDRAPQD